VRRIAPTHFGIFDDPQHHFNELEKSLDELEIWMKNTLPQTASVNELQTHLTDWTYQTARAGGLSEDLWHAYELVNPIWMSASGIFRYWNKIHRHTS
jgi:hypothetical protein